MPHRDYWMHMPKVLLHEHLDGGLRPATLFELAHAKKLQLPVQTEAQLRQWITANAHSASLERYVSAFWMAVAVMGDAAACERVAFEAAQDALDDGCVLAEFRMAPLLLEPHGLAPEAAVEALVRGLQKCALPSGLIVCAMRSDVPGEVERAARLAAKYAGQGVIGFDLAGAERGFPATLHRRAIDIAQHAGLGITLHAGEADVGGRVLESIALGATRIGHGVHIALGEDAPVLMAQAAAARTGDKGPVHFEVCPSSNVHTGVVARFADHPLPRMLQAGLSASVHTDNRLMSMVSHSMELSQVNRVLGIGDTQLLEMACAAAQASFLPLAQRAAAHGALMRWAESIRKIPSS